MAPASSPPATNADLQTALHDGLLRVFYGLSAAVSLLGAIAGLALGPQLSPLARLAIPLGYGALMLVAVAGLRQPAGQAGRWMPATVLGGLVLIAVVGVLSGWGLQTPGLLFFGLLVCLANTVGTRRVAALATGLGVAGVLAMGLGERSGWLHMDHDGPPLITRLVAHLAAVAAGALIGRALARLLRRHLQTAEAREQRFRTLLGIAASAYWETDATLRLTVVSWRERGGQFVPLPATLGRHPWEVAPPVPGQPGAEALRTAMQARAPLHEVAQSWQRHDGQLRHGLVSGEPRFAEDGRFAGYWGVVRDVTAEHAARQALAATESRYHELFRRVPSPLTLHRNGVVLDANPAAAHLLGYASVEAMLGHDLSTEHVAPDDRDLARQRMAQVQSEPLGTVLPATMLRLRTLQGGEVMVSTQAARADHEGRPAVLSISIDETERRTAMQALRRSQALLTQVVSLSPDVITLTDLHTGRYVMVNDSFARLLGRDTAAVVGLTSIELGVWRNAADRERLVQAIARDGMVQDLYVEFVVAQGRVVPLMISGTRFHSEGQDYLLLNGRDVSEMARVRLEREAILANASVGIAFMRRWAFVLANATFEQMFGWPVGSLAGQPGQRLWHDAADYRATIDALRPALRRGEVVDVERTARRRDGSSFRLRLRAKAIDPANPGDSGTIWIAEDVTLARQAEQALADARDAAEAASRAKSAFLANTSHEIRTPLNGLLGLARLARQPDLAPAQRQRYIAQIGDSAELLSLVITDILDVAKIEAGKLALEAAPFDLPALLHALQQVHAALAAAQGLAFEARLDPALPARVLGDALRVRQILGNFLHNALKFTAAGSIRLEARPLAGERVRFEVHDSGPGIAPEAQAQLFEPFSQADASITRRFGGTGLGLAISRELATLMGGQVGVHSVPGQGSCFYAELPLPPAPPPAPADATPVLDVARLQGARVLLVEDNGVNMLISAALLAQWGVQVTQAVDGYQALDAVAAEAAAGRRFDAVLMDVQMPGLSGYETTEALRRQHRPDELPVIALTAAALVGERERALAVGMNDFLTKPVDPARLQQALLRALGGDVSRA